jgi:hypothetical protein
MSQKQKLQEILNKLKSWSASSGDEELDQHLTDLENEINASFTPQTDEEEGEGGGGNHPPYQPGKP